MACHFAFKAFDVYAFYYIVEVLQDPAVSARLSDTKAATEVKALEDFYSMLQNDPNRAFYGFVNNFTFFNDHPVCYVFA